MTKSEKNANENIYVSLCKLQSQFTTVEKKRKGYQFMYADLADIWAVIRKPLADNGFSLVQLVETIEGRNYIITKLFHVSGECIESKTLIEFTAKKFQEVGSSITYYRRYALSAMLGIVSDQDVDDTPQSVDIYEKTALPTISGEQVKIIEALINGHENIRRRIVGEYKSIGNILVSDYTKVINAINKLIADKEKKQ